MSTDRRGDKDEQKLEMGPCGRRDVFPGGPWGVTEGELVLVSMNLGEQATASILFDGSRVTTLLALWVHCRFPLFQQRR